MSAYAFLAASIASILFIDSVTCGDPMSDIGIYQWVEHRTLWQRAARVLAIVACVAGIWLGTGVFFWLLKL